VQTTIIAKITQDSSWQIPNFAGALDQVAKLCPNLARPRLATQPKNNLVGAILSKNGRKRANDDFDVQPQTLVLDVLNVQFQPVVKIQVAATADLPQTG